MEIRRKRHSQEDYIAAETRIDDLYPIVDIHDHVIDIYAQYWVEGHVCNARLRSGVKSKRY